MISSRRITTLVLGTLAIGCAHRAPAPETSRAPAAASSERACERNGPCAVLGPIVHVFPLSRAQGTGVYGAMIPKTGPKFFTTTPEGCEAQGYRAGKRLAGYVDEMSLANDCTAFCGPVVSKTEQKNLKKLYAVTDPRSGFRFQSLNKSECEAQGFKVAPDAVGYVNP